MKITIHAAPNIPWQKRLAPIIQSGLSKHNIKANISNSQTRLAKTDICLVLGPNFWKQIEAVNKPYIMFNRKFLGDDVHNVIAVSWNGFNGNGIFSIKEVDPTKLLKFVKEEDISDSVMPQGDNYLLCEQADLGRCKKYTSLNEFYSQATKNIPSHLLKIRRKVSPENIGLKKFNEGFNKSLKNIKTALTLNSTVAVDILLKGIPIVAFDKGCPTYAVSSHSVDNLIFPYTRNFLEYLAMCQYHYDEIAIGSFWETIYPMTGNRLCDWNPENNH